MRWSVCGDVIEEVWLEDHIILLKSLLLFLALNVAEVRIAAELEGCLQRETSEGLVASDLMGCRQLEGTRRNHLAVVLNSADEIVDTIDLLKVNRDDQCGGVLLLTGSERVYLLDDLLGCLFRCLSRFFWLDLLVNEARVAGQHCLDLIVNALVLIIKSRERLEHEVSRQSIVEALLSELVAAGEDEAHGNVIVSVQSSELAPEEQLLKVSLLRSIQQLLKRQLKLKSTIGFRSSGHLPFLRVEADTVVLEVAERGR